MKKLRTSCSQPGLRLRDVGARHFANIKAVAGLFELLGEYFDVTTIKIKDRLIAQQIHVGSGGVEKNLLLVSRAPATWLSACRVRLAV